MALRAGPVVVEVERRTAVVSAGLVTVAAALALLREELAPGDVVLVKGSNATGLHVLGEALAGEGGAG